MQIEYIRKQDAIRWVKTECNPYGKPTLDYESGIRVMVHLKHMHSADVVQVVRCRDCARLNRNGYCTRFQNNISGIATSWFMPDDDDFCSYGERKE